MTPLLHIIQAFIALLWQVTNPEEGQAAHPPGQVIRPLGAIPFGEAPWQKRPMSMMMRLSAARLLALATAMVLALSGTLANAQEREWSLDVTDNDAYLVFGVPETEDVGASLWCTIRSGKVQIFAPITGGKHRDGEKARFVVTVDGHRHSYAGKVEIDDSATKPTIQASVGVDDRLFTELLTASYFELQADKRRISLPLANADIQGLLSLCRRA